jgi:uncharacterized repeat protein (TIGR01451 family)
MTTLHPALHSCAALLALFLAVQARGQAPASPLEIKSVAEVQSRATDPTSAPGGHGGAELIPADRVVPGDRVIYTLEVRNSSATALDAPDFTYPVPEHMRYVAGSAVGPGAEVSYSVDGGHSFARAENLKVKGPEGKLRPAVAADYTDIRWQLKNSLKPNSVAFVRFRTLVK